MQGGASKLRRFYSADIAGYYVATTALSVSDFRREALQLRRRLVGREQIRILYAIDR